MSDNFSAQRVMNQQLDGYDARLVDPDRPRCNRCTRLGYWGCDLPGSASGERCNFCARKKNAECNTTTVTMRQQAERTGDALPDYAPTRMAVQHEKPSGTGRRFQARGRRSGPQSYSQAPPPPPPQVAQGQTQSILPATVDAAILGQLQQITGMLQQQQEAAQPLTSRRRSRSPREAPHDDRRDSRRDVYRGEYREESRSDSYRTDYRQRDDYRSSDRGSHRDAYREEARASHRQSGRPALDYHRGDYSEDFRSDSHRTGYEHRDDYRSSYGGPRRDDYHEQARALPRQSNHRPAFDSQRGAADYPGRRYEASHSVSQNRSTSGQAYVEHTGLMSDMRQAENSTAQEAGIKKEDMTDDQTLVDPKNER